MSKLTTAVHKAPGIRPAKCYRYKWVVRGFWDFARKRAGAAPGGITWQRHHTVLMEIPEVVVVLAIMAMVVAVVLAIGITGPNR